MRLNNFYTALACTLILVTLLPYVSSESNISIETKSNIDSAHQCITEMQTLGIPIFRVNETYQEALQLYAAQSSLELQGKKADFNLVNEGAKKVCLLKETAIKAQDELNIFKAKFEASSKEIDVSALQSQYNDITKSFQEERFEDTLTLIQKGYDSLSEAEASQTTLNLFYKTTTQSIKNFFIDNWKKIIFILAILILVLIISWRALKRLNLQLKLYSLAMKEKSVNQLIKKMQEDYFEKKSLSETEFKVKMEKFKNILRDIKRQTPALREGLIKVKKETIKKQNVLPRIRKKG